MEDKKIKLEYVPTGDDVADIFTKALARPEFARFVEMLELADENK